MSEDVWNKCREILEDEYPPQQFNTWLRPLQAEFHDRGLVLLAPNRFVVDWVKRNFYSRIEEIVGQIGGDSFSLLSIGIGSKVVEPIVVDNPSTRVADNIPKANLKKAADYKNSYLNKKFIFESFVEGNSNQLARAASWQVAERPGDAYNPLFIYGGVGLGKTHLMHAIGNAILKNNPEARYFIYIPNVLLPIWLRLYRRIQLMNLNDFIVP